LLQSFETLKDEERSEFYELVHKKTKPDSVTSTWTLDAASKYFEFIRQKNSGFLSDADQGQRNAILNKRAALGDPKEVRKLAEIPEETRPDLGHDAYELSFRPGLLRDSKEEWHGFESLKLKSAYHDLLNNDLGFTRYSEIDFPWIELRYYPQIESLHIEELGGLRITSINPLNRMDIAPSWKFYGAIESPKDYGCINCRHASLEAGLGIAAEVFNYRYVTYAFLDARGEAGDSLPMGYRLLPGVEIGFLANPLPLYKVQLLGKHNWDVSPRPFKNRILTFQLNQSVSIARNWEIRQESKQILDPGAGRSVWTDASLSIKYFFR
jgi:hypothetical protein